MATTCHKVDEEDFYKPIGEKWSPAENLRHLTIAAKLFSRGLNAPKIALWLKFGRTLRKSKNKEEIVLNYQNAEFPAVTGFEPRFKDDSSKAKELEEFLKYHNEVVKALSNWSEFQINTYIIPQPILGKTTLREFLYFMVYHIGHHEKAALKQKAQKNLLD
jgi:hypothetical protein